MSGPRGGVSGPGVLVLVATPIGNLGDLSPRAVGALRDADVVCCEDTRRTRALLAAAAVSGGHRLVSLHDHNESARIPQVLGWLGEGLSVAVASDAGMPGISDPGARLVAAAIDMGYRVTVVPGPSAVLSALVVSGLPADRFCVEGFLPRKGAGRRRRVEALAAEQRTAVVLEAPGRLAGTLVELARACGDRPAAVVRELTKIHEEIWRGTLSEAATEFAARTVRGEVVIVVGGAPPQGPPPPDRVAEAVARRVAAGDGPRQAADTVAAHLGASRREAYQMAIDIHRAMDSAGQGPRPGVAAEKGR